MKKIIIQPLLSCWAVVKADRNTNGTVVQRMEYYPSGLQLCNNTTDSDKQMRRYNGKELDRMHGLNTYDYGARQYNPVTARWDRVDPLCEKYYGVSPYAYCGNNPMNRIDPNGMYFDEVNDKKAKKYEKKTEKKATKLERKAQRRIRKANTGPNCDRSKDYPPPFYYTNVEETFHKSRNSYYFEDRPSRDSRKTVNWNAELSLARPNNGYKPVVTLNYGFRNNNGLIHLNPITISAPSSFQKKLISDYNTRIK